ncbi:hypothetical protein CEXT_27551 [Caerostris extrusa]|uniref:Uncharacterized protein n=1 Tax=Caerostris extrusa TaxID=172846 RepID=A0AAV4T111_CAEEX|nr:hypothetical protein CEXT_27551 [Caerostris extrusa]
MPQDTIGIASHPLPCLVAICDVPPQMLEALEGAGPVRAAWGPVPFYRRDESTSLSKQIGSRKTPATKPTPLEDFRSICRLLSHVKSYISKR